VFLSEEKCILNDLWQNIHLIDHMLDSVQWVCT
jgi:hypothetical protein